MNTYGPSFFDIVANKLALRYATIPHGDWHKHFTAKINLKLHDNTGNPELANIFGVMVDETAYPETAYPAGGSQIPALFIQPNSMFLKACMGFDTETRCISFITTREADTWFWVRLEQQTWPDGKTYFYALLCDTKDEKAEDCDYQGKIENPNPQDYKDAKAYIGNTYKQDDITFASGEYFDFELWSSIDGSDLTYSLTEEPTI